MVYTKYESIEYIELDISILNNPVQIFEKLDGGNCQVRNDNWVIKAGSRSHDITGKEYYLNQKNPDKRWAWFKDLLKWAKSNHSIYSLPDNLIMFGEWLIKDPILGTQIPYSPENINHFYLIDLLDKNNKKFIEYEKAQKMLLDLNLKDIRFIRKIAEGKFSLNDLENLIGKSDYGNCKMEGLVIKDYKNKKFAKLLSPEFAEIRKDQKLPIVEKYITPARIRKTVYRLLEEKPQLLIENNPKKIEDEYKHSTSYSKVMRKEESQKIKLHFIEQIYKALQKEIKNSHGPTISEGEIREHIQEKYPEILSEIISNV